MSDKITWRNERRKLLELQGWALNPKRLSEKQGEGLRVSIDKFGFAVPLLISEDGEIYDGHQRKAIMELMEEYGANAEVDVRVSSRPLTFDERRELVVRLKQNQADWNFDMIGDIYEPEELEDWGFEEWQIGDIGFDEDEPAEDPGPQIDNAEELRDQWQTEVGQLWRIPSKTANGEHRIICGDCTDAAVVERVMGGEKADLVVTSPPYAVGKEYEDGVSFDEHLRLLRGVADMILMNVKPGGFAFTNFGEIAAQSHTRPLTGSDRQCIYPISKDYWKIFHEEREMDLYAMRIWYKPFHRLQQPFWTYHTSIPHHQEWEHIWTWRLPGGDGDQVYDWDISGRAVWDTRDEATEDKPLTRHVAAFPVCLPERAIRAHSAKGMIILEPFCGSATTIVAAERLGRLGRGIELSPAYVAVALQRLADMGLEPELVEV